MPAFEWRLCSDCHEPFMVPVPYEDQNPDIRDKCVECISKYQREHEKTEKEEWFS